jgi:hypothetical protein
MSDVFDFLAEKTLPNWSPVAVSIELVRRVKKSNSETNDRVRRTLELIEETLRITRKEESKPKDSSRI